jgi:hypothetical protein
MQEKFGGGGDFLYICFDVKGYGCVSITDALVPQQPLLRVALVL